MKNQVLKRKEKVLKLKRKKDSIFLIVFILILFTTNAFSQTPSPKEEGVLSSMEDKIFHIKYENEKNEDRLSRIEEFLFGVKYENKTYEERLEKIKVSLKATNTQPVQEIPPSNNIKETKTIDSSNEDIPKLPPNGIFETVTSIEKKIFGKTFESLPFQSRIIQLEQKILPESEATRYRSKTLMERVTHLISRTESSQVIKPRTYQNNQLNKLKATYRIDPNTGHIVNEITGEIVKDSNNTPIQVKIPTQIPNFLQRNQFPGQFPNQLPNQHQNNPLDFLYNPNNFDPSDNQNY